MDEKITFEDGMTRLEQLVNALEEGKLPFEETFRAYDEAMALTDRLNALLDEGARHILALKEDGSLEDIASEVSE